MDPAFNELMASFPGRKAQIKQLFNLFSDGEIFPDCVYVHGGPSTAKTTLIRKLLKVLDVTHAVVNLMECYTTKILLETILNRLMDHKVDLGNIQPYAKCDNLMEFADNLRKCSGEDSRSVVVVLDKAERLRDMEFNLLPGFLRLREITGVDISVIMISELVFQKFYAKINIVEPVKVHFAQYHMQEMIDILASDFEHARKTHYKEIVARVEIDSDFYRNYLNVFLSVFYRACRDLSELRYMARINFPKYCEPILRGDCSLNDSMSLWRHISPVLKSSLEVLYLRLSATKSSTLGKGNLAQSLELPFYAKYLLIAAYLASYNPAKDDKRLFMKFHGKKIKSKRDVKAKCVVSEQLSTQLGPKAFSFDRLLAIFYAILDDKVGFNNNLLIQVSSLVELQLLSALSDNYNLDGQRYKCTVGYDFVLTISKIVGFNLRKYLSDFSHL